MNDRLMVAASDWHETADVFACEEILPALNVEVKSDFNRGVEIRRGFIEDLLVFMQIGAVRVGDVLILAELNVQPR